jgi:hypothetical protein
MTYTNDQVAMSVLAVLAGIVLFYAVLGKALRIANWRPNSEEPALGENLFFFWQAMFIFVCIFIASGVVGCMAAISGNPALQSFTGLSAGWLSVCISLLLLLSLTVRLAEARVAKNNPAMQTQ